MVLLYREKQVLLRRGSSGGPVWCAISWLHRSRTPPGRAAVQSLSELDTRHPIPLSSPAGKEHRAVMLQHLETIQAIVNALVEEDYELAKGLTESHLGFFMHRLLISPAPPQARQDAALPVAHQQPENFLPAYHDLAMAHHEAAEELARIIPTKDLKQILPQFNNVLKA